mmetsp:Transcript_21115/g.49428  ORF Transcript_21115/g.49428 Transcript_21115/m.49428 type:complete len:340 (+) Transcript_21115:771-1790(+)
MEPESTAASSYGPELVSRTAESSGTATTTGPTPGTARSRGVTTAARCSLDEGGQAATHQLSRSHGCGAKCTVCPAYDAACSTCPRGWVWRLAATAAAECPERSWIWWRRRRPSRSATTPRARPATGSRTQQRLWIAAAATPHWRTIPSPTAASPTTAAAAKRCCVPAADRSAAYPAAADRSCVPPTTAASQSGPATAVPTGCTPSAISRSGSDTTAAPVSVEPGQSTVYATIAAPAAAGATTAAVGPAIIIWVPEPAGRSISAITATPATRWLPVQLQGGAAFVSGAVAVPSVSVQPPGAGCYRMMQRTKLFRDYCVHDDLAAVALMFRIKQLKIERRE